MIKLSPLEDFVKKYLKGINKSGNTRTILPFINKAIALIRIKLGENCCGDDAGTPITYTRQDNDFTFTVKYLLRKMYGPGTEKILRKVLRILEVFAGACCDIEVTITWTNIDSTGYVLTFVGEEGQGTFSTDNSGDDPQILKLKPGKYTIGIEISEDTTDSEVDVSTDEGSLFVVPGDVPPTTGSVSDQDLVSNYYISLNAV